MGVVGTCKVEGGGICCWEVVRPSGLLNFPLVESGTVDPPLLTGQGRLPLIVEVVWLHDRGIRKHIVGEPG